VSADGMIILVGSIVLGVLVILLILRVRKDQRRPK